MVVEALLPGAQARQGLVNQSVGHASIGGESLRQPGVPRRYPTRPLPQQDARGNASFNPGRIAFHILQNPFDHGNNTFIERSGQSR
jgi:hypothetical protein